MVFVWCFMSSVVVFVAAVVPRMIDHFFGNNQVEMKHPKVQEMKRPLKIDV